MTSKNNRRPPLCQAARKGNIAEVKRLIDGGVDVGARDKYGQTALHEAAWQGFTDIVIILVKAGAIVDAEENHGYTPLHWAARQGQTDTARALIELKADVNNAECNLSETPLHFAVWAGKFDTALFLVRAGAFLFARTDKGETPLDYAIRKHGKDSEIARILREAMEKQGG